MNAHVVAYPFVDFLMWNQCNDNVKITNLDSTSYRSQDPEKVLLQQEKLKRHKCHDICETHQESFHPFITLTDGMLAPEATKILQCLTQITADKQATEVIPSNCETS
jgi:hypothetical protein